MVLERKRRTGIGGVSISVQRKGTGQTISHLTYSGLTIHSVSRECLYSSYFTAFLFGLLISTCMACGLIIGIATKVGFFALSGLKDFILVNFIVKTGLLLLGCLLASFLNCMLIGVDHSAKEYEIFLSSMVYVPLLVFFGFLFPMIASIATFALVILNGYYLNTCYSSMLPFEDTRLAVLHNVYVFVSLCLLYSLLVYTIPLN